MVALQGQGKHFKAFQACRRSRLEHFGEGGNVVLLGTKCHSREALFDKIAAVVARHEARPARPTHSVPGICCTSRGRTSDAEAVGMCVWGGVGAQRTGTGKSHAIPGKLVEVWSA